MTDKTVVVGIIALGIIFMVGYLTFGKVFQEVRIDSSDNEKFCYADTDCVPAQCCHATDVINRRNAPECNDVACTEVCQPGTLDCGQGQIRCISNRCTAILNSEE